MGWGSDIKKAVEAAKKGGCDVDFFDGYVAYCKTADEAETLYKVLNTAKPAVAKFEDTPTGENAKAASLFYKLIGDYRKKAKELMKDFYPIAQKANKLATGTKDKAQTKLYSEIYNNLNFIRLYCDPGDAKWLFQDSRNEILKAKRELHKKEREAAMGDHEAAMELALKDLRIEWKVQWSHRLKTLEKEQAAELSGVEQFIDDGTYTSV